MSAMKSCHDQKRFRISHVQELSPKETCSGAYTRTTATSTQAILGT